MFGSSPLALIEITPAWLSFLNYFLVWFSFFFLPSEILVFPSKFSLKPSSSQSSLFFRLFHLFLSLQFPICLLMIPTLTLTWWTSFECSHVMTFSAALCLSPCPSLLTQLPCFPTHHHHVQIKRYSQILPPSPPTSNLPLNLVLSILLTYLLTWRFSLYSPHVFAGLLQPLLADFIPIQSLLHAAARMIIPNCTSLTCSNTAQVLTK